MPLYFGTRGQFRRSLECHLGLAERGQVKALGIAVWPMKEWGEGAGAQGTHAHACVLGVVTTPLCS